MLCFLFFVSVPVVLQIACQWCSVTKCHVLWLAAIKKAGGIEATRLVVVCLNTIYYSPQSEALLYS